MCGRFALTTPQDSVLATFAAEPSPRLAERLGNLGPRWNVCPTTDVPADGVRAPPTVFSRAPRGSPPAGSSRPPEDGAELVPLG